MSSFGETPAELVSDFASTYTYNLTFLGAVAWLVWEYVITFDREVALVWSRKVNSASMLFLLNRYIMLVQFAVQLPLSFTISDEWADTPDECRVLNRVLAVFSIAPYFVWAAFSALRAYAMSNRTWPIAILVFLLSITTACYNIYNFVKIVPINLPAPIFCIPTFPGITPTFIDQYVRPSLYDSSPYNANRKFSTAVRTTATRICLIIADALVIGVTWWRTWRFRVTAAQANVRTTFLQLLLRDGTIYFVILLILNILQIIVRITAQANFITTFEEPLTAILISRFLMNLREVDFAARDEPCGSASDPGAAADSALDFADRSHFTQSGTAHTGTVRGFVDSFVSPLGTQLDHDLLFASDSSDTRDGEQTGSGSDGNDDEGGGEKIGGVGEGEDKDGSMLASVLGEWVDTQRALQRVSEVYDEV
ncbi:hypothetical protein VTO73DRAFT_7122 [Trametes versicolor]